MCLQHGLDEGFEENTQICRLMANKFCLLIATLLLHYALLFINLCIINNLFLINIQHRNSTYQQKEDIYFIRYNR